ncbi:MAG: 3-methylornithine--L-lysine ligase PylC, partial [Deltaproteobacteria bacterium]|jgi:pyrrolysine biosynthesis protein PylC|nr:3-methylornithine--L-lysine ligase PylC [Deltaproteobacteria bacterium]
LEIDARFPSQTPTAVYWSTGVNLLVELAACFMQLPRSVVRAPMPEKPRKVIFEHVLIANGRRLPIGEHVISKMGPVKVVHNFMDAEEAWLSGKPNSTHFAATLIRRLD